MTSLNKLPPSFSKTFIIPVKLFRIIGFEIFDHGMDRFKYYCKFSIFLFMTFLFLAELICFFFKKDEMDADILDIANSITCLLLVVQSLCKISLIVKKDQVKSLIYDIAELWPAEFKNEEQRHLMESWLHRSNTFCDRVFKITIVGLYAYLWLPLIIYFIMLCFHKNTAYFMAFEVYYPFAIDSLWKYVLVYVKEVAITGSIYMCCYHAYDMFLFTLTVDVSMLFRLLQYDLMKINVKRLGVGAEESLDSLRNLVRRHQQLIKLAEKLDEIFGAIMLSVFIFSSIIICFFGFLSIVVHSFERTMYLTAALELLFSIFYIMLPGQILSDTSSGIGKAAYQCLWYNSDPRFQKMIYIIIARSQKPCKLRALGYADINFETFYKLRWSASPTNCYTVWRNFDSKTFIICGTTWSYLSVVNQMYQDYQL